VTTSFRLCENLSVRGSYGVMGISELALATDQVAQVNFITQTGISGNGNAFYHGAFLGLDYGY
jgi:hypothetical protein